MKSRPTHFLVCITFAFLNCACGSDPLGPDTEPPPAISDLSAAPVNSTTIRLRWTATGDNRSRGPASSYDLRYALLESTAAAFDSATVVPIGIAPKEAGRAETFEVTALAESTQYFFSIKAVDGSGLRSELSNVAHALTASGPDTIPPAAVSDLEIVGVSTGSIGLRWTAPGDDGAFGQAHSYELRYTQSAITEANWDEATTVRSIQQPSRAGTQEHFTVDGLNSDTNYTFALKTRDNRSNWSDLSNLSGSTTLHIPRHWIVRADGTGDVPTIQSALDILADGDTVLVAPGTYFENPVFPARNVVMKSISGYESTIVDGSRNARSVLGLTNPGDVLCVIDGFTITHGEEDTNPGGYGGGVRINRLSVVIRNCRIAHNKARTGGGISMWEGTASHRSIIEDCLIEDNESTFNAGGVAIFDTDMRRCVVRRNLGGSAGEADGGGIYLGGASTVEDCWISDNVATDHGGGINVWFATRFSVRNCVIVRNRALRSPANAMRGSGGGMHILHPGIVENCVIAYNIGGRTEDHAQGGGISVEIGQGAELVFRNNIVAHNSVYGFACWDNSTWIRSDNNIFWGNEPADLIVGTASDPSELGSCDSTWIAHQILADPLFCHPEHDDFRVSPDSPAILPDGKVIGILSSPGCGSLMNSRTVRTNGTRRDR